jgi:hypothetical protein
MSVSVWEAVFMLLVLKIPMIYLGAVVWWAVRAEPHAATGGDEVGVLTPLVPCGWEDWKRRRSSRPRGGRHPIRPLSPRPWVPARARAA